MGSAISISDSVQMYLVTIHRLAAETQPVPLSQLAAALGISPVSVNQMCRRLQDEGLVTYEPYKGVSVTDAGQQAAARIWRRHRLWEVFLVEHLQMGATAAHDTACQLEHATSDTLAERLAEFLSHPRVNPEGEPIPDSSGSLSSTHPHPLEAARAGQSGHCIRCTADEASCAFLTAQGLRPGAPFQVVATAPDSLLLEIRGRTIALDRSLATAILVEIEEDQQSPTT
jgi:DtxR family Mn-dependent transcriptional regulator